MSQDDYRKVFTEEALEDILPAETADQFFDALLGDSSEGAYDIRLAFCDQRPDTLIFELCLSRRPGKCLACNLTYGLPEVFSRHPIIDIDGMIKKVDALLNGAARCNGWQLGKTHEISRDVHAIPLIISLKQSP